MRRILPIILPALLLAAPSPPIQVTGLDTEAAATPLGIDAARPRFTWRIETGQPGVQQGSYRVVVATAERSAAEGRGAGIVWDSNVVGSSDPFAIYAGPPLASRTRYYWSVRISTADDPASYASSATWFETAYMNPGEWKGAWISGPKRLETPPTAAQGAADDTCCLRADSAATRAAGGAVQGEEPLDFCRPPGGRGNSGACREIRPAPLMRKAFAVEPVSKHGKVVSARIYSSGLAYDHMTLNGKPWLWCGRSASRSE